MATARLRFESPRCDQARRLNQLLDRRDAIFQNLRETEAAATFATPERLQASEALAALEARRASGEAGLDAALGKATKRLQRAKQAATPPSPEKLTGMRAAVRSADAAIAQYVGEHYDALAGEIEADAAQVKERADAALGEVLAAYRERERTVERWHGLIAVVARVEPGMVSWSKMDAVAREAESVLLGDGEAAPVPTRDPRVPRKGQHIPEAAWT